MFCDGRSVHRDGVGHRYAGRHAGAQQHVVTRARKSDPLQPPAFGLHRLGHGRQIIRRRNPQRVGAGQFLQQLLLVASDDQIEPFRRAASINSDSKT